MTLRGWLVSWRRLHLLRGAPWQGDQDPLLKAIRVGTSRRLPLAPPKRRIRAGLLSRLLKECIKADYFVTGAAFCLAYVFALRVPSELLAQGRRSQFKVFADRICYTGLKRKGRTQLSELVRSCTCRTSPLLCPHPWLACAQKGSSGDQLFKLSGAKFQARLQHFLALAGVPAGQLAGYTSHAFRRGVGVDVLQQHGLQAMLACGEWRSPQSAAPYATLDEIDRFVLGSMVAEASGDES